MSDKEFVAVWETAAPRHDIDRALSLLALSSDGDEDLAGLPLGARNWRLLQLRRALFGDHLSLWSDCTSCGTRLDLSLNTHDLPAYQSAQATVHVDGTELRLPTSRDLAQAVLAGVKDGGELAFRLLQSCVQSGKVPSPGILERAGAALDAADPWADPELDVVCPECGAAQQVRLDIAGVLWDEVAARAAQLLNDIHILAGAYGWDEDTILSLSPTRRAYYLERIEHDRSVS
ncbi:hypothetical protein [Okeania sp. SIO2B9]|uniref:hypothetical protein n=1 Tax=Okeania sp. SIO2B9 TaxID=2607782 RepID=UPI00142B8DA4|nr:hypothetical protein [Okeania sp. SIO2B9]NES93333.1 hypothetical protein [Okeania sp. SIO2B9]